MCWIPTGHNHISRTILIACLHGSLKTSHFINLNHCIPVGARPRAGEMIREVGGLGLGGPRGKGSPSISKGPKPPIQLLHLLLYIIYTIIYLLLYAIAEKQSKRSKKGPFCYIFGPPGPSQEMELMGPGGEGPSRSPPPPPRFLQSWWKLRSMPQKPHPKATPHLFPLLHSLLHSLPHSLLHTPAGNTAPIHTTATLPVGIVRDKAASLSDQFGISLAQVRSTGPRAASEQLRRSFGAALGSPARCGRQPGGTELSMPRGGAAAARARRNWRHAG